MKDKAKKFVGPTKKMADALETEGLHVTWPKVIKDDNDLAIEGSFTTGEGWEKIVLIDLRDEGDLSTKANVDAAISNQLDEAYECFSIDDEVKLHLGTNGAPEAPRLVEDMQEQNKRLKRFAEVAEAVSSGRPVPPEEDKMVTFTLTFDEANALARVILKLQKQMGE